MNYFLVRMMPLPDGYTRVSIYHVRPGVKGSTQRHSLLVMRVFIGPSGEAKVYARESVQRRKKIYPRTYRNTHLIVWARVP